MILIYQFYNKAYDYIYKEGKDRDEDMYEDKKLQEYAEGLRRYVKLDKYGEQTYRVFTITIYSRVKNLNSVSIFVVLPFLKLK